VCAYDTIADWSEAWVGSASLADDAVFTAAATLMGDVKGLRVCDLACGQGRVARYLADRGALVTAIDISAKLLELARGYEARDPRRALNRSRWRAARKLSRGRSGPKFQPRSWSAARKRERRTSLAVPSTGVVIVAHGQALAAIASDAGSYSHEDVGLPRGAA
jgi:SAM-dependent methyltransferase